MDNTHDVTYRLTGATYQFRAKLAARGWTYRPTIKAWTIADVATDPNQGRYRGCVLACGPAQGLMTEVWRSTHYVAPVTALADPRCNGWESNASDYEDGPRSW